MQIKASQNAIDFIKQEEGFISKAKPDLKTGKMAIGYGDTEGNSSKPITEAEASQRLLARVKLAEDELSKVVKREDLTQGQIDVLVDKHYNMGLGNMQGFINIVNSGDDVRAHNELLRYNTAYNEDTKQNEVVEALVNRTKKRQQLWSSELSQKYESPTDNSDILGGLEEFHSQKANADILDGLSEFKRSGQGANTPEAIEAGLSLAASGSNNEQLLFNQEAQNLSERTGISLEQARIRLSSKTPAEVYTEHTDSTLAKHFPVTANWSQDPDNYVLRRNTWDFSQKLEMTARPLNKEKMTNFEKTLRSNPITFQQALIHSQMLTGLMSTEEGSARLNELDLEQQKYALEGSGAEKVQKSWQEKDFYGIFQNLIKYPYDTALVVGQSAGTSLAPVVAGGFVGGPAGMGAVGATLAFNEYMNDWLSKYRDPRTGYIDFRMAYSDPEEVAMVRTQAGIYASAMGVSEWAGGKALGGMINKFVPKATSTAGKIAVAGGAGLVAESSQETLGQTTALTAVDFYKGDLTKEKFKENVKEGAVEGVASLFFGPAVGAIQLGTGIAKDRIKNYVTPKDSAIKTLKVVDEANRATESATAIQEVKNLKASEPETEKNKAQIDELIAQTVNPPPIPEDVYAPIPEGEETQIESQIRVDETEAQEGVIEVSPHELEAFANIKGVDLVELISTFPIEIQQEFAKSRNTDSSFVMPTEVWIEATKNIPEIELIARVNGNEYNALEANDIADGIEKDPYVFFDQETVEPPPIPAPPGWREIGEGTDQGDLRTSEEGIEIVEATSPEGNLISRPVFLRGKFRDSADKKLMKSLLSRLKQTTKGSNVEDDGFLEFVADVQARHMRNRADMLGMSIADLSNRLKIGKVKDVSDADEKYTRGVFQYRGVGNHYTVAFSKIAETKTVIHEFGHSWLQEMAEDYDYVNSIPEAELTPAQAEYKYGMNVAADAFGLDNIGELMGMTGEERKRIHETFAQTSEKYFAEGKFENSKIKKMMQAFSQWIVRSLQAVGYSYSQYPALEISPEVERMFEGILGVNNKVEEEIIPMFPEPAFPLGMLGAKADKYAADLASARSNAIGEAVYNSIAKFEKAREAEINKNIDAIVDEAEKEIDELASMKMLKVFEKDYADFKKGKITSDPRFSYESVLQVLFGNDQAKMDEAKKTIPQAMVSGKKKGGIDVSEFMAAMGITDPNEMLAYVLETGMRDQKLQELVDQKVSKGFPNTKSDQEIHEAAVEAVNSAGREKIIMSEIGYFIDDFRASFRALIEKGMLPPQYAGDRPTRELINQIGLMKVLKTSAFKFSSGKFLKDSMRHGRRAAQIFRQGDIQEAFSYKFKEAVHFFGYKHAKNAMVGISQANLLEAKTMKYATSKDYTKKYDADVMTYARAIVEVVNRGLSVPEFNTENFSAQSGITDEMIKAVENARMNFLALSQDGTGSKLTVQGKIAYGDFLKQILFVAKRAKAVEVDGKEMQIEAVSTAAGAEISSAPRTITYEKGSTLGIGSRRADLNNVSTMLAGIFPSDLAYSRSMLASLFQSVRQGEALHNAEYSKEYSQLVKSIKKLCKGDNALVQLLNPLLVRAMPSKSMSIMSKPVYSKELDFTFNNKGEVFMAILLMSSESGAKKFLLGNTKKDGSSLSKIDFETGALDITPFVNFVNGMIARKEITKQHFEALSEIVSIFNRIHPGVKEAIRKSDGWNMGNIKGWGVQYSLGRFDGGYVPVRKLGGTQTGLLSTLSVDSNNMFIADLYPHMNTGLTNERDEKYYPTDLDMNRLASYISAALSIKHLRNPMMDFGRVIESDAVMEALEEKRPGAFQRVIVPWFQAVLNQQVTESPKGNLDVVARYLRTNANIATYAFSVLTGPRQLLGFFPVMAKVRPDYMLHATASFKLSPRETIRFMKEMSPFMAERLDNSQNAMIRDWNNIDKNFDWIHFSQDWIQKISYWYPTMFQSYVDIVAWNGAYKEAMGKGMAPSKAAVYADNIIEKTQGSYAVTSMANVNRGRDFEKFFKTAINVKVALQNLIDAEVQRNPNVSKRAAVVAAMGIFVLLVPAFIDSAITVSVFPKEDEDEDKKTDEEKDQDYQTTLNNRMAGEVIDTIFPFYGRLASGVLSYGKVSLGPAFNKLDKVPVAMKAFENIKDEVPLTPYEIGALTDTLTLLTGIPISILGKGVMLEDKGSSQEEKMERRFERKQAIEEAKFRTFNEE